MSQHTRHTRETKLQHILYGRKFWRGVYFGELAVLRAICQYFIRQKLHSVMSSLLQNHSLCTRPAAKRTSLIVGIEFTIESCVQGHRFSKEFCTPKEKSWLVCQRDEGDPSDVYMVVVKTDRTKTVQIKRNNDLLSFQLHLIIDFVLTERQLAHGQVKFPVHSISHFAMNIIMAKTGSTAKVNFAKGHISAIRQNIFPPKFPAIRYRT